MMQESEINQLLDKESKLYTIDEVSSGEGNVEHGNESQKSPTYEIAQVIWEPVRISRVIALEITNKEYYHTDEEISLPSIIPGQSRNFNKQGLLRSADLKLQVEIPSFYYAGNSKKDFFASLSYRISQAFGPSNIQIIVQLVSNKSILPNNNNNSNNNQNNDINGDSNVNGELSVFSMTIPIYRGLESIGSLPLVDELFNYQKKMIHFTAIIEGLYAEPSRPPPYRQQNWYIRLILTGFEDISIVSTSTSAIDTQRLYDVVSSSVSYISSSTQSIVGRVFSLFTVCWAPPNTLHNDNLPKLTSNEAPTLTSGENNLPEQLYSSLPSTSSSVSV